MYRVRMRAGLLATVLAASSCAYFLSPQQRGNHAGPLDGPALVGDILWFIPGIIPGVVALAVDFSSGAIHKYPAAYGGGQRPSGQLGPASPPPVAAEKTFQAGTRLLIRRPVMKRPSWFEVRLLDGKGRTLAGAGDRVQPGQPSGGALELQLPSTRGLRGRLELVVDGAVLHQVSCRIL